MWMKLPEGWELRQIAISVPLPDGRQLAWHQNIPCRSDEEGKKHGDVAMKQLQPFYEELWKGHPKPEQPLKAA